MNAQTCTPFTQTMFYQDFETPTSSTLNETVNSAKSTVNYSNNTNYAIGKRSRMVNKKNADIDYGNANVSYASNVKVSFSFAPQNIDYISDNIKFYISTNGGTTWSKELEIYSKNYYTFLFWDFSSPLTYDFSSTNIYTSTYDGNNSPDILYISDTNKKNKVEISIPNNVNKTNLRFKFEIENNDNDDYWFLDDIKITGDYIDTKTWNGTSWTGRTTSTPSNKDIIVINGNYNTKNNGNISACECTINANQTLSVNADTNITIQNNIINNGNIIVENDGNLIQVNDNATFTGNPITVYRETNLKRLDYNYWSSPVENQNLQSFSPNTLSNRFYTYNESNDYFATITPSTNNFVPAKGYAIRSPNNFGTSNSVFKGVFNGKPNNGVKTTDIYKNGNGNNLVGNPYPSNISFASFYAANSSIIEPKAYIWTNTNPNPPVMQGSSYSGDNYAIMNITGAKPAQNQKVSEKPTDAIVVGQGFIVKKRNPGTENITFNNSMRVTNKGKFSNARIASVEEPKVWLQLLTPAKNFNTILIGYVKGATNDIDNEYDASLISKTSDMFYTIVNNQNLAIQGRSSNFSTEDRVQIGAVHYEPGTYEISISQAEGIFNGTQPIYLKDNVLNKTVNLSAGAYSFYSEAGEINNRFEIAYTPESTLGVGNVSKNKETVIYKNAELITVENKTNKITSVQIFDATGKLVTSAKPNSNQFSIESSKFQKGLVLFKITTNKKTETKKFFVQ